MTESSEQDTPDQGPGQGSTEQGSTEQGSTTWGWDPATKQFVSVDPERDPTRNPAQQQEWLGQNTFTYGGLIGIGVVMVQPFLVTPASVDLSAKICIGAFSLAIPILAALMLLNRQELFRRQSANSPLVLGAQGLGQGLAILGIVAGFWHIFWLAGVGVLVGGLLGLIAHTVGYTRLDRDGGVVYPVSKMSKWDRELRSRQDLPQDRGEGVDEQPDPEQGEQGGGTVPDRPLR